MLTPRTKHKALEHHHFRSCADNRLIYVESIRTNKKVVDLFTKPIREPQFTNLRKMLNGH